MLSFEGMLSLGSMCAPPLCDKLSDQLSELVNALCVLVNGLSELFLLLSVVLILLAILPKQETAAGNRETYSPDKLYNELDDLLHIIISLYSNSPPERAAAADKRHKAQGVAM